MNNYFKIQTLVAAITIALLIFATKINSMPNMDPDFVETLPYALLAFVAVLVGLFVFERRGDERDVLHRHIADRCALFAVIAVLGVGIFVDQLHQVCNPWMVGALVAAIVTKIISRVYSAYYQ
jgi:low temperature requirement protein LtrA